MLRRSACSLRQEEAHGCARCLPCVSPEVGGEEWEEGVMRRPDRAYITVGHLASQFGWRYGHLIQRLEAKRIAKSKEYFEKKNSEKKTEKASE